MPAEFKIHRVVSSGSKGTQILVLFNGKSVTRHIVNGVGRHPDDSLPTLYKKLEDRLSEAKSSKAQAEEAIPMLEKTKAKYYQQHILDLQKKIKQYEDSAATLATALDQVRKENPLMVRYIV